MLKPSISKLWMPAVCFAAIAAVAVALLGHVSSPRVSNQPSVVLSAPGITLQQSKRAGADFAALPLAFESNQGQTDSRVKYLARGNGYTVFLTPTQTVFTMSPGSRQPHKFGSDSRTLQADKSAEIFMSLVGANPKPVIAAANELPGQTNYYIGNNPKNWQLGVKQYAAVNYGNVYPGVDMAFHGQQRQFEFDFVVAPHANPAPISFGVQGSQKIATDADGNLILSSSIGNVTLHKPVAYQDRNSSREPVDARFVIEANNTVSFQLGAYDHSRELVIDPSVTYATYLGGSAEDEGLAIALDSAGNAYITGQTKSPLFGGQTTSGTNFSVFVTKMNTGGTALTYTDIFSATGAGSGNCTGNGIALDSSGNVYVAGSATAGFPLMSAYQSSFGGGLDDAFVLKLNTSGVLVYSTYLGGTGNDNANAITVDSSGNAYVVGETQSANFPTTSGSKQPSLNGTDNAFVTKLNSSGSALVYSTYLGGALAGNLATGVALDSSKNAYVSGITISSDFPTTSSVIQTTYGGSEDGFVTEVKADGSDWLYSTFLGGSGSDDALAIAVDSAGEAYVAGRTSSTNFPTLNAPQPSLGGNSATNVFVSKLNAGATALVFSTYIGGSQDDEGTGIALDSFADAYITGKATSSGYPVSSGASLTGSPDAFVTELSNSGFAVYSILVGGNLAEDIYPATTNTSLGAIAVDSSSNAYITGATNSTSGFPVTSGVYQSAFAGGLNDAFVAKVGAAPADFSVTVTPSSASATSGQSTSSLTVTVSSVNSAYGQAVSLSCSSLPSKAGCQFGSASLTPTGTAQTTTLTISTNGTASAMLTPLNRNMRVFLATFLPIGAITLLGAGFSSRKKRLGFLLLGIVLCGLLVLPACGGGSGGGGGGGTTTPPGTYTITVSGMGGGVTHSYPVTLTVN